MALTRSTAARNAASDAVVDRIDLGTGIANGQLILMTSGDVEVATLDFANPAFGNAGASVAGRADANTITGDASATGGEIALFKAVDRDGVEVYRGTVSTILAGTGDLQLTSTTIVATEPVDVSSLTYAPGS